MRCTDIDEVEDLPEMVIDCHLESDDALRTSMLSSFQRTHERQDETSPSFCWRWIHDQHDDFLAKDME